MLLVEEFLQKMLQTTKSVLAKRSDRFVASGMNALLQAVREGEKVYFAPSTMSMLLEKLQHYDDVVEEVLAAIGEQSHEEIYQRALSFRGTWVEFDKPIKIYETSIAALLCFMPSQYLVTGREGYQLYLVDQFADVADLLESREPGAAWEFARPFHRCPLCEEEYGVLLPCDACKMTLVVCSHIFALAMIISGQYLAALRYEEKTLTGMRRVQRERSQKERRIPVKHVFKVIDANEIIIPVPTADSPREHEPRGSWLQAAQAEGDLDYQEKRTRPFIRTYRHERYRASGLQGQSMSFPQGIVRQQPVRKSREEKRVTRVKASLYEGK